MDPARQQHRNSIALAEAALGKIGEYAQPADPRSFALWLKFAGGDSGLLSAAINSRLATAGTLTAADIDELHDAHIAPAAKPEAIERVGGRIGDEIERALAAVESAEATAGYYSRNLGNAARTLGAAKDRAAVRAVVDSLAAASKDQAAVNAMLQLQLQAMSEEISQLRRDLNIMRSESQTDPLTQLGNRAHFLKALQKAIAECHAARDPLTLLLANVDHIRTINDSYGNVVGDRALRFIAMLIKESITGRDVAARSGEDLFAVILPRTSLPPAVKMAEQLRHAVTRCELVRRTTGERARLTLSVGVATLDRDLCAQGLIEAAEMCLHAAKRSGRNCVVSEADEKLLSGIAGAAPSGTQS